MNPIPIILLAAVTAAGFLIGGLSGALVAFIAWAVIIVIANVFL